MYSQKARNSVNHPRKLHQIFTLNLLKINSLTLCAHIQPQNQEKKKSAKVSRAVKIYARDKISPYIIVTRSRNKTNYIIHIKKEAKRSK